MKDIFFFLLYSCCIICFASCTNHQRNGDIYYAQATDAIKKDSLIQAFSFGEKALNEYCASENISKENKARILIGLLYFSTDQKDAAYDCINAMNMDFLKDVDYPLYSNYYRIKAYYNSIYEKNLVAAIAMMDSVLAFDNIFAKGDNRILNLDRLNKCEILLNGAQTQNVKMLIDSVMKTTPLPSEIEPQIYANLARWYEFEQLPDSAYKYAKLVVDKTSKIYEDIDNNIYALNIILRYDSLNNNLSEYIQYREMLETLKDERQGERMKFGMAFVKEQNKSETMRLKAQNERKILGWICISIFLVAIIVVIILIQKHKDALIRNEMIKLECDKLDAEAFRRKLENEILIHKINSKSDELTKANNEILELSHLLVKKNTPSGKDENSCLQRLLDTVNINYPDFQSRLIDKYPDVTKTESSLASLIKLNLSSEEITAALSITKAGLIKARYRLRKKLGIDSSAELDNFIFQL